MVNIFEEWPLDVELINLRTILDPRYEKPALIGGIYIEFIDGNDLILPFKLVAYSENDETTRIFSEYIYQDNTILTEITRTFLAREDEFELVNFAGRTLINESEVNDFNQTVELFRISAASGPKTKFKCKLCKNVFNIASAIGCEAGVGAICTAASGGTLTVACTLIAGIVCYFIGKHGTSQGAQYACQKLRLCP